jgi:predicted nuclease with RNAse H fold
VIAPGHPDPLRAVHVRAGEALTSVARLLQGGALSAVGLDGPVRPDFTLTTRGRACERRLLGAPFHRHCKPGSTAAPMGQRLHAEATRLARAIAQTHPGARVVEAFPSAFLRTLLSEDAVGRIPRHCKSQVYWERCVADGVLARLVADLYGTDAPPIMARLTALTHRDQRAAAVCALTATSAGRGDAVEVGDAEDGWISLAPRPFLADWARAAL